MRSNFQAAIANLYEFEGFKSDDTAGGETYYGIARNFHPTIPWPPTWEEAKAIYLKDYWIAGGCDELPFPMDVIHFDSCVNPGPGAAHTFLRDSGEHEDVLRRCVEYLMCRQEYYLERVRKRPDNLTYICGWMARTFKMMRRTVINSWDAEV